MTTAEQAPGAPHAAGDGPTLVGVAMILVGLLFLADRAEWFDVRISGHHWPLIPMFLGTVRLLVPHDRDGRRRSRRSGLWLLAIGVWGTVSEFQLFGLDYSSSWPLLVIAAGLNMVWRSFDPESVGRAARRAEQAREN